MKKGMLRIPMQGITLMCTLVVPAGASEGTTAPGGPQEAALGAPSVNTEVENLVPFETVRRIALHKAREVWGKASPGRPVACSDENGDIVAYMWPFRIGVEPFPAYDQVLAGVRQGRSLVDSLEKGLPMPADAGPPGRVELNASRTDEPSARNRVTEARRKAIGAGEYGTVYASARYDRHPVPLVSHYLSPYYTTADLAQEKVRGVLHAVSLPTLSRVYFLGLRGQYFEFTDGPDTVVIQAQSLEVERIEPVARAAPPPDRLERIRKEWAALERAVEGGVQ